MKKTRTPRNKYASHAVDFINNLSHTGDYSGEPFKLRKWQEQIVRNIFGHRTKADDRLIQRVFLLLPRANGKTELCAAIALYCLLTFPPGQQIYSCGADREQAARIYDAARQMVENDPVLLEILGGDDSIVKSQKRLVYPEKHSFYCALSSEARRKHGLAPSVVLFDELHAQPNDQLWHALSTGISKRSSPLWISITTAGVADPNHIAYQEYQLAKRIDEGIVVDSTYLPVLYEAGEDDDWEDERTWKKCNPALGDFKNLEVLRTEFKTAKELPSRQNAFRQYHLNQWLQQSHRWLDMSLWDKGNSQNCNLEELKSYPCWAGLDLAPVHDLSALCLLFDVDGVFHTIPYVWINETDLHQRSQRDRVPYEVWERQGFLTTTTGNSTDFAQIRSDILAITEDLNLQLLAADRNHAYQLCQELSEQDGVPIRWCNQGFSHMSPACHGLEKMLLDESLIHGGSPILRWAASNVTVQTDSAGQIRPDKEKSTERIDPIVALIMAIAAHQSAPVESTTSIYETRGVLTI